MRNSKGKGKSWACVGLVYDHHKRNLVNKILHLQHETPARVMGAQHFHLDHHHCVETILLRGNACEAERFQKNLQNLRGIKHTSLSVLSPAKHLA